jgi:hypothetical protein
MPAAYLVSPLAREWRSSTSALRIVQLTHEDGKDCPYTGSPDFETVAVKRVEWTYRLRERDAGTPTERPNPRRRLASIIAMPILPEASVNAAGSAVELTVLQLTRYALGRCEPRWTTVPLPSIPSVRSVGNPIPYS